MVSGRSLSPIDGGLVRCLRPCTGMAGAAAGLPALATTGRLQADPLMAQNWKGGCLSNRFEIGLLNGDQG